ncbi:MAG: hypothetical protein KF795_13370 [Labilithrix sp.]|nr:hypothetical protein [Labilithrix sp.]
MRASLRFVFALSCLPVAAALIGCSSTEKDDEPLGMTVEKVCLETQCDARHRRDGEACSRCMDACLDASFSCDPSRSCSISCGRASTCSDDDRAACNKEGFRGELGTHSNAEVEAACTRYFDHLASCNLAVPGRDVSVCSAWAKVERLEVAKIYDCSIAQGCSGDPTACRLPPTTLGDELCGALDGACEETICSAETRAGLNDLGAWLRDDVTAAAKKCAAQASCTDAQDCLTAWIDSAQL